MYLAAGGFLISEEPQRGGRLRERVSAVREQLPRTRLNLGCRETCISLVCMVCSRGVNERTFGGVSSGHFATELGFVLSEELRPDVIDTLTDMSIIMPLTVQYM